MKSNFDKSHKKVKSDIFSNNSQKRLNLNLSTTEHLINDSININTDDNSEINYNTINHFHVQRKKIPSKFKKFNEINKPLKNKISRNRTQDKYISTKPNDSFKNINDDLTKLIKRINFNNLNEYYKIESNIFIKKIQKLNLKFYYTSEILLTEKKIKFPYDELFLILFKEISLYIEEIERLNKQLVTKSKNVINYNKKIQKIGQNEKNNVLNKSNLKNLQNKINLLQKENEKYKNNIDKLNKKLNSYTNSNKLNKTINLNNNNYISSSNNSDYGMKSLGNSTLDSFNSPLKNSKIISNKKYDKTKKENKTEINDIVKNGIKQCEEEINNLSKIEGLLINKIKHKNNNIKNK